LAKPSPVSCVFAGDALYPLNRALLKETEPVRRRCHELTRRQLEQSTKDLLAAVKKMNDAEHMAIIDTDLQVKAEDMFNDAQDRSLY
jgi:hypothetical protein